MSDATPSTAKRIPTAALLVSAAFGAFQAMLFVAIVPITTVLAVSSPPAYALVASVHSMMPFLARIVTGTRGMATFTAFVTGVLTAAVSPIGPLAAVPMLVAAIVLDLLLPSRRDQPARTARVLLAGGIAGVALFAVSLPVFSPEHLAWPVLLATLIARVVGELAMAYLVIVVARLLVRAGVVRTPLPSRARIGRIRSSRRRRGGTAPQSSTGRRAASDA